MPDRQVQMCYYAAYRRLHAFKRGKWEEDELGRLFEVVHALGSKIKDAATGLTR
jgi:hypothetical protein